MAAITSRYARALADAVQDTKADPRRVEEELRTLADIVNSAPELRTVWENPAVEANEKRAVLDQIGERTGTSRIVRNFMAVLIDHRRVTSLPAILRQVEVEFDERLGLAMAEVTTSRPLADQQKRELERRVGAVTGKTIRARYATDDALLGGAVVKVGSTVYDGSIRGQLERLKEELSEV
ncbi:MAG: ATP synthase F1 subunit delta [Acidobacteria bacterium]|nr:ATP synthase F1 subunit delta [Acidobacteriota bacterium]